MLHDFGKVGVRERVLVKAKKLYEEDLRDHPPALRVHHARRCEAEHARAQAPAWRWSCGNTDRSRRASRQHRRRARGARWTSSTSAARFVERANEPTRARSGRASSGSVEIARLAYLDAPAASCARTSNPDEVAALQVRRGSLTDDRTQPRSRATSSTPTTSCARSPGAAAARTCRASPARTTNS